MRVLRRATGAWKRAVWLRPMILRGCRRTTNGEGVEQTARYVDRCAAEAGHLVVIDRRENRSWEEKIFRIRCSAHLPRAGGAAPVAVWGM